MKSFYATSWDNWCLTNSGAGDAKPQHPLHDGTLLRVNMGLPWESGRGTGGGHGEELPCRGRYCWEGTKQTLTFTCLLFLPTGNWDKLVLRARWYLSRARYKEHRVNYQPSPMISRGLFLPPPGPLSCPPVTSHRVISSTAATPLAEAHTYHLCSLHPLWKWAPLSRSSSFLFIPIPLSREGNYTGRAKGLHPFHAPCFGFSLEYPEASSKGKKPKPTKKKGGWPLEKFAYVWTAGKVVKCTTVMNWNTLICEKKISACGLNNRVAGTTCNPMLSITYNISIYYNPCTTKSYNKPSPSQCYSTGFSEVTKS